MGKTLSHAIYNCRIKAGTYTGDGSEGLAITGVGFAPKFVKLWKHPTAEAPVNSPIEKLNQTWGDYALFHNNIATAEHKYFDDKINSLDVDGFTVDSAGTDEIPNTNGVVFDYLCLG